MAGCPLSVTSPLCLLGWEPFSMALTPTLHTCPAFVPQMLTAPPGLLGTMPRHRTLSQGVTSTLEKGTMSRRQLGHLLSFLEAEAMQVPNEGDEASWFAGHCPDLAPKVPQTRNQANQDSWSPTLSLRICERDALSETDPSSRTSLGEGKEEGGTTRQTAGHEQRESGVVRREGLYQGVVGEEAKWTFCTYGLSVPWNLLIGRKGKPWGSDGGWCFPRWILEMETVACSLVHTCLGSSCPHLYPCWYPHAPHCRASCVMTFSPLTSMTSHLNALRRAPVPSLSLLWCPWEGNIGMSVGSLTSYCNDWVNFGTFLIFGAL